jgi:hypothetical protein
MKMYLILLFFILFYDISAQVKINDFFNSSDAYLGKTPPQETPKLFLSGISERIAISPDGREIYIFDGKEVAYYKYLDKIWSGPEILFKGFGNPGLSIDGNTLFLQDSTGETWYSLRNGKSWTTPKVLFNIPGKKHYLQVTASGNIYFTTNPKISKIGDISRIIPENMNKIESLENPINTENNGADFFIARDESYMILIVRNIGFGQGDINISYHKKDGWTIPKNLEMPINSSGWEWGPYVSPDNKFLFFTRDGNTFWVRIDDLIGDLKESNRLP